MLLRKAGSSHRRTQKNTANRFCVFLCSSVALLFLCFLWRLFPCSPVAQRAAAAGSGSGAPTFSGNNVTFTTLSGFRYRRAASRMVAASILL